MNGRNLPGPLRRYVLHFETQIEEAAARFSRMLPERSMVLDAGAGESQYAHLFAAHRYVAVDLGVGDTAWNYRKLDAVADLSCLPFAEGQFDATINIVTLEHVREPALVIAELARTLRAGGKLLLIVPHEWEVHQEPHDYFRYTVHGARYLLEKAGFGSIEIQPVGGFFRLLSRRLLNALQFFPGPLFLFGALVFAPPALLLPLLDPLDKRKNFTLGYICTAVKC